MTTIVEQINSLPTQLSAAYHEHIHKPVAEKLTFLKHYIWSPEVVGSIIPSSSIAAHAIVKQLRDSTEQNRRILEIGAGTGVFTKAVLGEMRDGDHFDVVEFVPEMAKMLQSIVDASDRSSQVTVHCVGIEEFEGMRDKYTHVISALPLTYFKPEMVKAYYEKLGTELLADNAKYSCIEYPVLPKLRLLGQQAWSVIDPAPYKNLTAILDEKHAFLADRDHHKDFVMLNIPPAHIVHMTGDSMSSALNLAIGEASDEK